MEDLNKTQLILLTLLVSFVTSIATGIITSSLLQEAPSNVTQTINRVVEKTIERVVPAEGGGEEKVREVTVVVSEEDLVIDAISKTSKSIVRIRDNALIDGVSQFYGLGFLVSKSGLVLAARRDTLNLSSTYTAIFPNGTSFLMKVEEINENANLAFFTILQEPKKNIPTEPVGFSDTDPKLGQTIIAVEGQDKDVVSIGRVSSYVFADPNAPADKQVIVRVNSDVSAKTLVVGGPVINLSGEVAGLRVAAAEGATLSFVPSSLFKSTVASLSR